MTCHGHRICRNCRLSSTFAHFARTPLAAKLGKLGVSKFCNTRFSPACEKSRCHSGGKPGKRGSFGERKWAKVELRGGEEIRGRDPCRLVRQVNQFAG